MKIVLADESITEHRRLFFLRDETQRNVKGRVATYRKSDGPSIRHTLAVSFRFDRWTIIGLVVESWRQLLSLF